jgi:hypothetical protein
MRIFWKVSLGFWRKSGSERDCRLVVSQYSLKSLSLLNLHGGRQSVGYKVATKETPATETPNLPIHTIHPLRPGTIFYRVADDASPSSGIRVSNKDF